MVDKEYSGAVYSTLASIFAQFLNIIIIIIIPMINSSQQNAIFEFNYLAGALLFTTSAGYLSLPKRSIKRLTFTTLTNLTLIIGAIGILSEFKMNMIFWLLLTCVAMSVAEIFFAKAVHDKILSRQLVYKISVPLIKFSMIICVFWTDQIKINLNPNFYFIALLVICTFIMIFVSKYYFDIAQFQANYIIYFFYSCMPLFISSRTDSDSNIALYLTVLNFSLMPISIYMHRRTIPNLTQLGQSNDYTQKWFYLSALTPLIMLTSTFKSYFEIIEIWPTIIVSIITLIRISNTYYSLKLQIPSKQKTRMKVLLIGTFFYLIVSYSFLRSGLTSDNIALLLAFAGSELLLGLMYRKSNDEY